ncbi:sn-glycerol-3-phosphate ABC transporter ATP-binding protein UgpC [Pelagibius sp. CAU 1746]|uniref:ABC transporter ATP-binding protein n=1 Tax=Pelagibius sp. CAU 1746 TaxID=3140370 RepID=UPI00325B5416
MEGLTASAVRKSFGAEQVIKSVDLSIEPGEFVVFVGPSGCGKSTLLRMIAGLESVTAGQIHLNGRRIDGLAPADRRVSMVFQTYALYPHMSARRNIDFGLRIRGVPKDRREAEVNAAAAMLSLTDLLERRPGALSGGQRQRVAIGRSIVSHPELFLFDEPLSNLDAALRGKMRVELARLQKELGAMMIYVTHDQVEAMTMADRIVVLNAGRVEQAGAPLDLYHRPANRFVAGFLGAPPMNFIPAEADGASLRLGADGAVDAARWPGRPAHGALTLGVRPEAVTLGPPEDGLIRAEVAAVERLGSHSHVHLNVGSDDPMVVVVSGTASERAGDRVGVRFDVEDAHLFDAAGTTVAPVENPA